MKFLIDGYNLMHALGLARPRGPKQLERSRTDLIDWVLRVHGADARSVTVVFDGRERVGERDEILIDRELRIRFSAGESADDLIEEMIRREANPKTLTVVSSDRRLMDAARRRGCLAWSCGDYIEWAIERGHVPRQPPPADKPESAPQEETDFWKREFADLDADPNLRKFNKPFDDFYQI